MGRILSVSYDQPLALTRQMLLQKQGHHVVSALGVTEAARQCGIGGFDLFILGHSISRSDKATLIETFRHKCAAPILSLRRPDEPTLEGANYHILPDDPQELLELVAAIIRGHASAAGE